MTGAKLQRPASTGLAALTPSERRIVDLAANGASNTEIAQALFVTVKTVEMHLGNAYRKLGISSRRQLAPLRRRQTLGAEYRDDPVAVRPDRREDFARHPYVAIERSSMFARLSVYENVDLNLTDQVKQWMERLATDPFGDLPGYRGSMTLVDRDNARLVGIGFYASAGQAQEADALLTTMYEQPRDQVPEPIRPALDMRPESVGLYEIVHRD